MSGGYDLAGPINVSEIIRASHLQFLLIASSGGHASFHLIPPPSHPLLSSPRADWEIWKDERLVRFERGWTCLSFPIYAGCEELSNELGQAPKR
jgi:hypothetical protein